MNTIHKLRLELTDKGNYDKILVYSTKYDTLFACRVSRLLTLPISKVERMTDKIKNYRFVDIKTYLAIL